MGVVVVIVVVVVGGGVGGGVILVIVILVAGGGGTGVDGRGYSCSGGGIRRKMGRYMTAPGRGFGSDDAAAGQRTIDPTRLLTLTFFVLGRGPSLSHSLSRTHTSSSLTPRLSLGGEGAGGGGGALARWVTVRVWEEGVRMKKNKVGWDEET